MSLNPNDDRRRGRSKSPGGGRRERSRSRVEIDEYEETTTRERSRVRVPSPPSSNRYDDRGGYEYEDTRRREEVKVVTAEPRGSERSLVDRERDPRGSDPRLVNADPRGSYGSLHQYRDRDESPPPPSATRGYAMPGGFQEEDVKRTYESSRGGREKEYYESKTERKKFSTKDDLAYGESPPREPPGRKYQEVDKYKYDSREDERDPRRYDASGHGRGASFSAHTPHHSISAGVNVNHGQPQYVQPPSPSQYQVPGGYGQPPVGYPEPGAGRGYEPPGSKYAEAPKWEYAKPTEQITYSKVQETTYGHPGAYDPRPAEPRHNSYPRYDDRSSKSKTDSRYEEDSRSSKSKTQVLTVEPGSRRRDPSPGPGLAPRMHSLSVNTGHHGGAALSLATAPGSPLLESYHGTYQSISPMPSPLMIPSHSHTDINFIEPLSPARFHDPVDEATILAKALKGEKRAPDTQPLIEILPGLTHEQVLDLRVEFLRRRPLPGPKEKRTARFHDPVDEATILAKALKGEKRAPDTQPLIEILPGLTHEQVLDLRVEYKQDKFKKAVLLVLDERKMEERPGYPVDRILVEDDVHDLYKAVRSEKGGETAMINIVVVRSDAHLREVLRLYEVTYRANFAREMLKKSGNLVGEMLAHILNGVINKPVRDALLVHHALSLSKSDSIRTELLISRLVRYHWDRPHMELVKREYRTRYGVDMQRAVAEGTKGEWGHFCEMLCVRRMGDEVRSVERVEEYRVDIRR
ncbi:uncharacterized protein PAC_13756 [Phialocephala subalpina]|uniref:Annexin XIV n=1 Tax=Phialocephala subalpina TaxID=576137 RepID=A0A1L7XFN8_9HELO|nr:uncharacterized protein PAC_13756 [Phialocephala subalpina]